LPQYPEIGIFIPDIGLFATLYIPNCSTGYTLFQNTLYFSGSGCTGTAYTINMEMYQLFQSYAGAFYTGASLCPAYQSFTYGSSIGTNGTCTDCSGSGCTISTPVYGANPIPDFSFPGQLETITFEGCS
jgi:hypothetical protein